MWERDGPGTSRSPGSCRACSSLPGAPLGFQLPPPPQVQVPATRSPRTESSRLCHAELGDTRSNTGTHRQNTGSTGSPALFSLFTGESESDLGGDGVWG